jgi:peptide/nickel transport system substrate-binding protein
VKRRLCLALILVLAAAWTWTLSAQAQTAGELRVALPWTPENLDPTMNLASIRAAVGVSLFDSLVGRDSDNRIVPQLAESWKLLDELTWQFKLRRGVVFHNGEPFNAEAVRATVDLK